MQTEEQNNQQYCNKCWDKGAFMNTANNRRRKESREKIEKVFVELLQTRELSQISVSDICKQASLNRTTFYANYTDIYGLADAIRDRLETNLLELYQEEHTTGINSNDYLKLFRHIQQNQIFYQTYFKLGYDDNYKIISYDTELAQKYFQGRFIQFHMEFFKSGLTRIIKLWLQNGCRETPEDMFEIIKSEFQGREAFFASSAE